MKYSILHLPSILVCVAIFLSGNTKLYAATFIVDVLSDSDNLAGYTNNDGNNTLRKCIRLANTNTGSDVIYFKSTLSGTISLTNNLILLSDAATTIDGSTASGALPGVPSIQIDGGNIFTGIRISAGNCIINTLGIIRCSAAGITLLSSASGCIIQGCYIGINLAGIASGNGTHGILVSTANNTIGGSGLGERNIISSNSDEGVRIMSSASGNTIKGNFIGVGVDGESPRGNGSNGIWVFDGSNNTTIGGIANGAGNTIGWNEQCGIWIGNGTGTNSGTSIQGNYIGISTMGVPTGNQGYGIAFFSQGISSTNNIIGAAASIPLPGEANTIAYNGSNGVYFQEINQLFNPIRGNSIYCNGGISGLAIDLWAGLANGGLPAPVIDYSASTANVVNGTCLNGNDVHIYRNTLLTTNCSCQTELYVGKATTTGTNWSLTHNLSLSESEQLALTAIQTDLTNNSSPASECASVLPLVFLSFSFDNIRNEYIELKWTTTREVNNSYFEVQKSTDLIEWNLVAVVNATGKPSNSYTIKDEFPQKGNNYYRIKQIDQNNSNKSYSPIIAVEFNEIQFFSISPNPASEILQIRFSSSKLTDENILVSLYNLQGIVVREMNKSPKNDLLEIEIGDLKPGNYFISMNDGTISYKKIVTIQ